MPDSETPTEKAARFAAAAAALAAEKAARVPTERINRAAWPNGWKGRLITFPREGVLAATPPCGFNSWVRCCVCPNSRYRDVVVRV
jgi:hypothetical protein